MSIDITADSATQYEAGEAQHNSAARLGDNAFVIAFADANDNNKGKAIVGTRSGYAVTISAGDVAQFLADEVDNVKVVALSSSLIVICFKDKNDSEKAMVIAGAISGTTITFGTAVEAANDVEGLTICALDATHFIVSYAHNNLVPTAEGNSKIGAVATTTITLGAAQQFYAAALRSGIMSDKLDDTHYVVHYIKTDNKGYAKAAEVDIGGDSITFGAEAHDSWSSVVTRSSLAVLDRTHFVIVGEYSGGYRVRGAIVDEATEAISFGAEDADDDSTYGLYLSACKIDSNHFLLSCRIQGDGKGRVISGTISGNTATFDSGSPTLFETDATAYTTICRLTNSYFLIAFNETP